MNVFPAVRPAISAAIQTPFNKGSGGAASIIAGLFAQGQQGFWLPFTDFASLSQDSAGTLPYTALEQPVGLILDKSKGGGCGPEMVADPEMTTLVGLSNNGGLSSPFEIVPWHGASTALHVVGPRYSGTIIPGTSANTLYYVEARIWVVTGSVYFGSPTATVGGAVVTASSGWQEVKGYISSSSAGLPILSNVAGSEWYLDRISIRQVLGNHASQPTSTARGVVSAAVVSPPTRPYYLQLDGVDDYYTCGGGGSTTGFYYSDVVRPMSTGANQFLFSDRTNTIYHGYDLFIAADGSLRMYSLGAPSTLTILISTDKLVFGALNHVEAFDDGLVLSVRINGGTPTTIARTPVTAGNSTVLLYKATAGLASGYFNGQATEPIYRAGPPPSASERATIMGYQKQKAGL